MCAHMNPNMTGAVIMGTTFATSLAASTLALPAMLGVRRLVTTRWATPFERNGIERQAVLLASLAGALGAVAVSDGIAMLLGLSSDIGEIASILLCFIAPVPLATVPWVAGELLSGASERPWRSWLAAVAASCVTSWIVFALNWMNSRHAPFFPGLLIIQLAGTALAALAGAGAYLATRGSYSSSMSENRSFLGCSSGFF